MGKAVSHCGSSRVSDLLLIKEEEELPTEEGSLGSFQNELLGHVMVCYG